MRQRATMAFKSLYRQRYLKNKCWVCSTCTLLNPSDIPICGACGTRVESNSHNNTKSYSHRTKKKTSLIQCYKRDLLPMISKEYEKYFHLQDIAKEHSNSLPSLEITSMNFTH